ncbi:NAD(P)/FAD-dependent oxidoreductase [Amphritea atlantica]|uniref:NAD(P)/FAD-dependent oxidoreductase n=1 Tax=Amphritea atlantica TaxID=355243 RepID=A0ABY5GYH8_9GAMM|nr:NAD(P)/FAD-dependent oxidoreductase [Amphritea atlantica]
MSQPTFHNVIIIGAGLSGLTTAHALKAKGIKATIIDAASQIAEPWRARHPQLKLNIYRKFASLPGLPMDKRHGDFVPRDAVVGHLETFARQLNLPIQFETEVQQISRQGEHWRVDTNKGSLESNHIVVATGREKIPYIPDWPERDTYSGEILHAAALGDIARYAERDILVVGAGNSGTDVLNHLSRIPTGKVWVSLRHGPTIMPTRLFGFPMHRLAKLFTLLPLPVLDAALALTQRLVYGKLSRYGLHSHPDGGGTRLNVDGISPALDDGFVAALKRGQMQIVSETMAFNTDAVQLGDGSIIKPEIIICATGYRSGLEGWFAGMGVLNRDGRPKCSAGEFDPSHPGLWFCGYKTTLTGYFDAATVAAKRIADGIASRHSSYKRGSTHSRQDPSSSAPNPEPS